jgi:D-alanine-D-alanine ligase
MKEDPEKHSGLRVGIACNLKTDHSSDQEAEFDEPETVSAIAQALREGGYEPVVLEATERFPQKLEAERPDIVFNIAEGRAGRDREAQIPAILEYYGVPFTGSDAATLSIALDKSLTKELAAARGVPTPASFLLRKGDAALPENVRFPILVKPNAEGSSKGISDVSVAADRGELQELTRRELELYGEDLLAEEYIDGREFTVGILGNGPGIRVFTPMEILYRRLRGRYKVYSFEVKRNYRDYIAYQCPPQLPPELCARMMDEARTVYQALGCLDFARIDFRLAPDGTAYFIEANPLPGLAPGYSDYPMLAGFNGVSYGELVRAVLRCALERSGRKAEENHG